MYVIGTAGHVDHGKSTLVKRLTGIDPDRLAEEKAREMTIDLGFAWLTLPNGETIGIVDVPGHRDFIENMLAGVGGIDAVLLVIAADEGVMPQTREHLEILDLLGIERGLVILSKVDMVDDAEWLELVEHDILSVLQNTSLENADIVRVSAQRGTGLNTLIERLTSLLNETAPKPDYNHPRLPVDRVFTVSGFGTVVTGTLLGGTLRVGDEVEAQPGGRRARVRGLQNHRQQVEFLTPGSRAAVNLAGIERSAIQRGDVLVSPGQLQPTTLIDVRFRHLLSAPRALKHNAEIKFFSGTSESTGHVRLLDDEALEPGAEGWLQIRLEKPLAIARGDRFVVRYPSPAETIGGGLIVNPHPGRRWRRFQEHVIHQLETQMLGSPAERVVQAAEQPEPVKKGELQSLVGQSDHELQLALHEALREGLLTQFADGTFLSTARVNALLHRMLHELAAFHQAEPLRLGMSREELRSRLKVKNSTLTALLSSQDDIIDEGKLLRLKNHQIRFTDEQARDIAALMRLMDNAPYTPPSPAEASQIIGENTLRALIELGEFVLVQPDVIFTAAAYQEMVTTTLAIIDREGSITAKALRDHFDTSRKYAIGLLEHLDSLGITRRVGDERVRGRNSTLIEDSALSRRSPPQSQA